MKRTCLWLAGFVALAACAGTPGPRRLFPTGGDQFSLLDRAPPPPSARAPLVCSGKPAQRFACFMSDLNQRFDQAGVSGALAVLDEDGTVHSDAHAAPGQPPLGPEARFAIASLSKTALAVAALALVDAGKLDLQKPVASYLAELAGSPAGSVTVHQLLSHTAGLPEVVTPGACEPGTDLDTVLRRLKDRPLLAPAGTVHIYSNVGYAVVGAVIERVAGARFEDVVRTRVLVPAGMATASYQANAPGSVAPASGASLVPLCRAFAPAGGLWASAPEMLRLLQMLLAGGGKVLRAESAMAMQRPHAPTGTGDQDAYGYGLGTTRSGGVTLLNHNGRSPQFAAAWALVPERHFAAVVLVNRDQVPAPTVFRAAQVFLGLTAAAPTPQARPISDWSRYVGQYRDGVGALGSLTVTLDGDQLRLRFLEREPAGGLPPQVTFLPGGVQARFVVTPIGVAERVP